MYKGKSLKEKNAAVFKKCNDFLRSSGIDLNRPPNPYQLIKDEEQRQRDNLAKNRQNKTSWVDTIKERVSNGNIELESNSEDSVVVSTEDISRNGFDRGLNLNRSIGSGNSYSTYQQQSFSRNANMSQKPQSSSVAGSIFQRQQNQSNMSQSSNSAWSDQQVLNNQPKLQSFFKPKTSPDPPSSNTSPNNQFPQNHWSSNNPSNQSNNSKEIFKNLNFIEQLLEDTESQQPQEQPQSDFRFTEFQYNDEPLPAVQFGNYANLPVKTSKARDIFGKKQEIQGRKGNSGLQMTRKGNQGLCGLIECDSNKKLTTVKILESTGPKMLDNYQIGDVKMWQIKGSYSDHNLKTALKNFPHIKDFKNNQKAIIKCALNNNNVFTCIPTGGGKSLIFQIMTFIKKGIYLCILPLISLIYDQQLQAQKFKIEAYSLTGATTPSKVKEIYAKLSSYSQGDDSLLIFCTPEKISLSQAFVEILQRKYHEGMLQHVIIDEVHCVSTWGRQFRKEYENLSQVKQYFPNTPILALTATVTEIVKQQIINRLNIKQCFFFQSGFNRPNLMYQVRQKTKKSALEEISSILPQYKNKSGIIYCLSKRQCQEMCKSLNGRGYMTAFYHADLKDGEKRQIQSMWMQNKINIIIATIAFGMGINKPDVRFVIHNSLSKSLQNYYQQSGRAGRDGQPAKCVLFYQRSDRTALQSMILKNQHSSAASKQFSNRQLAQMVKYCEQKFICRRQFQLNYLGEKDFDPKVCNKTCDNCQKGRQFRQYECIQHGKEIVKLLEHVSSNRDRITKAQFVMLLKGKENKKGKSSRSIGYSSLVKVQELFKYWTNDQLEELILELLSEEILRENVVSTMVKKVGNVTNVYLECNFAKSKKFLDRVETLPMRREYWDDKKGGNMNEDRVKFFEDLFADEDEENQSQKIEIEEKPDFSRRDSLEERVDYSNDYLGHLQPTNTKYNSYIDSSQNPNTKQTNITNTYQQSVDNYEHFPSDYPQQFNHQQPQSYEQQNYQQYQQQNYHPNFPDFYEQTPSDQPQSIFSKNKVQMAKSQISSQKKDEEIAKIFDFMECLFDDDSKQREYEI